MGLGYYSVWPALLIMAMLLALASTSLFKAADAPPSDTKARVKALDGLRGFLAFGVFFGHAAQYHRYLQNGFWGSASQFNDMIQVGAVALFFMITGYLFWGKLLADAGRTDFLRLYVGRVFRIGPIYLVAITGMLAIVFLKTLPGREPLPAIGREMASWAMLGVNYTKSEVNGFANPHFILLGVTWTLHFEWLFYFSLIALAIPARLKHHLPVVAIALVVCLSHLCLTHTTGIKIEMFSALFLFGMLSASMEKQGWLIHGNQAVKSGLAIVFLALFAATHSTVYAPLAALALGALFFSVISGADFFGLLTSKPARRLGDVSFGVYLLQGLVVTAAFSIPWMRSTALASPASHWAIMGMCASVLLLIATAAHIYVERPGIRAGKATARFLHQPFRQSFERHRNARALSLSE